ncbi:hypothetical protein Tco_1362701 [Tanacetum coccineum]
MADNRTMAQMLQAPIEGYEDAIVVPLINANNFELKQTLINLVQSNQFTVKEQVDKQELKMTLKKLVKESCRITSVRFKRFNHRYNSEMKQAVDCSQNKRLKEEIGSTITILWQRSGVLPAESSSTDTPLAEQKAHATLTQELKECKTNLDESSRALGEATSIRDIL